MNKDLNKEAMRNMKKKIQTINAGEGVEKREHSYIVGGNVS